MAADWSYIFGTIYFKVVESVKVERDFKLQRYKLSGTSTRLRVYKEEHGSTGTD